MQLEDLERHHFGQTVHSRPATAKETVGLALTTNLGFLLVLGEPRWFASFV